MSTTYRPLRDWQKTCLAKLEAAFDRDRRFLAVATPGAGKTTLALSFANKLVRDGKIDHVHVVTPTRPLRQHWQDAGVEFGLRLGRRSNTTLKNGQLPFDVSGVTTTYAQIAREPDAHLAAVENKKALVILDEVHHAGDRRSWGEGITDAFGASARFILSLSGTPFRNDDRAISLLTYNADGVTKADHIYSYAEAIKDNVCRPVVFHPYNALIEYKAKGEMFERSFSDDMPERQMSDVLRYALHPDAGLVEKMVRDADDELSAIRARGARWQDAGGLLVAMSQAHALKCAEVVRDVTGEEPTIVVSDSETAEEDLNAFKAGMGRWVIAVRMISEGVDIPRLMVSVYATNVISTLFFRQFVGRVVRVRHQNMEEVASVFVPGDARLLKEASDIEAEVKQFLRDADPNAFSAVRKQVAESERRLVEVAPKLSEIEGGALIYRGERFTPDEISEALSLKDFFPLSERLDPVQIAYTIRRLRARDAAE